MAFKVVAKRKSCVFLLSTDAPSSNDERTVLKPTMTILMRLQAALVQSF